MEHYTVKFWIRIISDSPYIGPREIVVKANSHEQAKQDVITTYNALTNYPIIVIQH